MKVSIAIPSNIERSLQLTQDIFVNQITSYSDNFIYNKTYYLAQGEALNNNHFGRVVYYQTYDFIFQELSWCQDQRYNRIKIR